MKKSKVLYIGNMLAIHGANPTSVDLLGERLSSDFNVVRASSKRNQLVRLFHIWWVIFTNRKCDFLLIDTYSTSAFVFAWTSARLAEVLRIKYIPILHGGDLPKRIETSPDKLERLLTKAYKVVSPSSYLKSAMQGFVEREYEVIPNFIDIANYPFKPERTDLSDQLKILWVRSFHSIYNPQLAVRLLKKMIDLGFYNTELCMVGPDKDGSLNEVKSLARQLKVENNLMITGGLSKTDWIALSANYNLFINTTNVDNAPVSVVEAAALGMPIITTNVGGLPFIITDRVNGILVPPNDEIAFCNAIQELVESAELRSQIVQGGRNLALTWDWQAVRKQWVELLKKID